MQASPQRSFVVLDAELLELIEDQALYTHSYKDENLVMYACYKEALLRK